MRNGFIAGSGFYVPEKVINNQYFNELLGEDVDTWLVQNLTIRERRWCNENESTADLCLNAAKLALQNSSTKAEDLDLIIIATDTPEYISPSTASVIQYRLKAVNAGSFDVNTACAGFVTALDMSVKYIRSDENYNNILVVGAYAMSKYLNLHDKKTVTLFADGAGAFVVKSTESSTKGMLSSQLITQGQYCDWMGIYGGGTKNPISEKVIANKDHLLKFVTKFPKELNPKIWTEMVLTGCKRLNITPHDIDHFFFTQININSIWETLDNLNVDHSKTYTVMDRYGYTGSACIPMAFEDAKNKGKLKEGDLVCFVGSGGGLAFASAIFKL